MAVSYTHLCVEEYAGKRFSETPGAGAAGGLGFAFLFGLENVELKSGIDIAVSYTHLDVYKRQPHGQA